jgi:glutathione S-transferase
MDLYYFETMNPRKACVTAKYLELPVTYHRLDPEQGEHESAAHLARNPNGKVPVLVDGDLKLWESVAIMVHLAIKAGSDLWPTSDPIRQTEVMRWVSWDLCHWVPHVATFYFEHLLKPKLLHQPPDPKVLEATTPQLHSSAKILDAHLADHEFVAASKLSIADFCLGILLPYSREIHVPLGNYKNIQRWHDSLMKLDAWRNPWPS